MTAAIALERAQGALSLRVGRRGEARGNAILGLSQAGCGRLLFPAIAAGATREAVIVNTAGGLTGGDRFDVEAAVSSDASLVMTTQACERLYRSSGGSARVSTRLDVAPGARLDWLPQETILFEGSALVRSLDVSIGAGARFLAIEAVILGRRASGERLGTVSFRDSWRIRREGRLVFAEEAAFGPSIEPAMAAPPALAGAGAIATILLVADNAEAYLEPVRALPTIEASEAGFTAFDGLFVARVIAQDGAALRRVVLPVLRALGGSVPLVWSL